MNASNSLQSSDSYQKHVVLTGLSADEVLKRRTQFGENPLGWLLIALGVAYPSGMVIYYHRRQQRRQ